MQQRIQKRRTLEAKDQEFRRRVAETNILAGHATSEARVDKMRQARNDAAERKELFMDYAYTQSAQDKAMRTNLAAFETSMADGLLRQKAHQQREAMDRKRICDGSEELRVLKEKLHLAKVNKERAQQLLEIQVRNERTRLQEHAIAEYMENERVAHLEVEARLEMDKAKQRGHVKHINLQQIAGKEAQREEAREEFRKEKDQVQALVDKIAEEDRVELTARAQKKKETREQLLQFAADQKARHEATERAEREHDERIEEFARQKREHEAKVQAEKDAAANEKQRVFAHIVLQMEHKAREKGEMEQLRNDLHLEELQAENRRQEQMQLRKRLEDKEEMKQAYSNALRCKAEKAALEKAEEDKIRAELMRKFAEDDRLELMSQQRQRMRVQEHKREIDRMLADKREMYRQAREEELKEEEKWREGEVKRQVVIEEERRRLIAEHAAELKNFLPKDILEGPDDFTLISSEA